MTRHGVCAPTRSSALFYQSALTPGTLLDCLNVRQPAFAHALDADAPTVAHHKDHPHLNVLNQYDRAKHLFCLANCRQRLKIDEIPASKKPLAQCVHSSVLNYSGTREYCYAQPDP